MYKNKKDVDKYVENLLSKHSAKDFKTRAYSIARLYFDVGDYTSCQKYVEQYLTQKENNAAAYKLLGQALQKLGQKDKALEQFKISLEIDPAQTSTILDICELLADQEVPVEPGRANYWCEKAEAIFPRNPITFRLREKLVSLSNTDPKALVELLKAELAVRPKDATLHARLLKHYLNTNNYKEAFEHSCQVEFSVDNFINNYSWYETLNELLCNNIGNASDWLFQLLLLTVKERLCVLSLTEVPNGSSKGIVEACQLLHSYDQALEQISKSGPPPGFVEFHKSLLQHHRGQLVFHVGTYLLKKAKKNQLGWREALKTAAPFILLAYQTIPLDTNIKWVKNASEKQSIAVNRWYTEGTYRCSQSGHFLISNFQDKSQAFLDQVGQHCSGTHWKEKLYEKIFTSESNSSSKKSSYLLSIAVTVPILKLPRKAEVMTYDDDAQKQHGNSLHHFVWTLLNYKNYADFKCALFEMLSPTAAVLGPEALNKFDIYAFLYCATLTSQQHKPDKISYVTEKPAMIPANITDLLCPLSQMKWWDCAYKFSQNQLGTELTDIRATLSRGIEVIRCVDNHGLDPELLCKLGRIFNELAKKTTAIEDKTYSEKRSYLYFGSAIPLLEKLKSKTMIKVSDKRLFDYTHKELTTRELNSLLEECKLSVALNHLNENEYEKVIELLANIKSPLAYYHLAYTYRKISIDENDSAILDKAKKIVFKALDALKETESYKTNPLYTEIQNLIEDIESQVNRVDLDSSDNMNDIDGKYSSDENISFRTAPTKTNRQIFRNVSSTPKGNQNVNNTTYKSAIDSHILEMTRLDQQHLERIENEIKNLQKRDSHIESFMDQTKDWFEENRKLGQQIMTSINSNIQNTTDQFKLLKISVDQVKDQIDECRNECKDVGDLKKQIAELKKEVNKLKKSSSEQTIDESDLYTLDDDYRTNDSASTFAPQLPFAPQVLPPFNQRPPFPIPPNPYQLYNQNLFNLYNQYTQFAQSSVPGASQLFDATRAQMNYPGVYPNPEQMFLDVAHLIPPTVPPAPIVTVVPTMPVVTTLNVLSSASTGPIFSAATLATSTAFKTNNTTTSIDSKDVARSLPVNVVITSSDPLPTCVSAPAPVLSVTIPQKHIKGTPHNYQIQMPTVTETAVSPPVFSFTMPDNKSNKTTGPTSLSNWKQTFQPFNTPNNSLDNSTSVVDGPYSSGSPNTSFNKSRTLSEKSNTSVENYDPCPDFKPIVPLPDEVKVTTGEEDETVIFSSRAKLFRYDDKQWKERGLGEMKLLKHKVTNKVRVLMRREQVHKICANHLITQEMEIKPMKNETKAYMWVANDFADEKLIFEKFCIRFKTAELAKQFFDVFEKARLEATSSPNTSVTENIETKPVIKPTSSIISNFTGAPPLIADSQTTKTMIGGFSFSSTPVFKPLENNNKSEEKPNETVTSKPNIFGGLTFKTGTTSFSNLFNSTVNPPKIENKQDNDINKLNSSDTVEEFEPNVEFQPVVPLPALIDQKTGEEDETILFEHRAKLLRFDSATKEWKERGLGNIKILINKNNNHKIRLLMRREQIMKVCCNHSLTKEMSFQKMPNMEKAVTWCAKDFSEGELVAETFCLRFKTVQICDEFIETIKTAQTKMQDDTKAAKEEKNAAKQVGLNKLSTSQVPEGAASSNTTSSSGWGGKFKPKPGSWECQACFVRNVADLDICSACNGPKDPNAKKNTSSTITDTNLPKFTFGIPAKKVEQPTEKPAGAGFGDKFKPKEGSWECQQCFVRNDSAQNNCCACNSARNPDLAKEQKASAPSTNKFQFGIPLSQNNDLPKPVSSIFDGTGGQQFTFGIPAPKEMDQQPKSTIFGTPQIVDGAGPINLSKIVMKPSLLPTPQTGPLNDLKETKKFDFVFKPTETDNLTNKAQLEKNQSKEDSEDEYVKEEDCSAHFTPVIPMPDKVEVVTGEENEIELFAHRAKLYVFSDVEWKERGLGIVKLLKHKETNKLRIVMRREQVLKICLNHALAPEITYTSKDEKSWLFAANDFSEGQISFHQFCLRFGKKEVAMEFKKAVDNARQEQPGHIVKANISNLEKDNEDVVFVTEIQATDEEKRQAKELMLPENFYTYKTKDPCQGCRGCDEDDKSKKLKSPLEKPITPFSSATVATPLKSTGPNILSPTNSMYGTPGNSDRTFDTSIFRTPLGSLGSQTLTPTNNTQDVTISDNTNKENIFSQTSSIFSSFTEENSIFGTHQTKPFTMFGSGDYQTPASTNNLLIAPPKLSTQTTSAEKPLETPPTSIFNSAQVKPVFGESTSIFGGSGISSNKSIFGFTADKPKDNSKSETKSIFGSGDQKPIGSGLFGNTNQGNIFGSNSLNQNATKPEPIVGGAAPQNTQNVFKSIFSNNANQGSIWNSGSDSNQRANFTLTQALGKETQAAETAEPLFLQKPENNLSFANFASSQPATFQKKEDFQWEGAGQQLFKVKDVNNSKNDSSTADEEYDPHYEPIVPLPDEIVVTTGEEEEEKVFGERAKLYRYDDKAREWKERGVGEMKILYHPQRNTYRLLLRREQVYKAVLNMLVYNELELLPMKNSDQAWTWIGRNFAEVSSGAQETLAVRFKNAVLANQFREKVIQCVRKLQAAAATAIREQKEAEEKASTGIAPLRLPKHLGTAARADNIIASAIAKEMQETPSETKPNGGENKQVHFEEPEQEEHDYDEDDDDEDDEDHDYDEEDYNEDDEESAAFYSCDGEVVVQQDVHETTCGKAHIMVMFDHDMCSPKILVTDANTGEILADMLIHTDTEFHTIGEKICKWSGTDYTTNEPVDKTITAKFYDTNTLMEFYDSCETSKGATYSSNDPES